MSDHASWRELLRCDHLAQAHVLATTIESMEFDVRLRHVATGRRVQLDAGPPEPAPGPYLLEVRAEEWSDLVDVVDQIVEEQGDFDDALVHRDGLMRRYQRGFILALVVIVAVLALLGIIDL